MNKSNSFSNARRASVGAVAIGDDNEPDRPVERPADHAPIGAPVTWLEFEDKIDLNRSWYYNVAEDRAVWEPAPQAAVVSVFNEKRHAQWKQQAYAVWGYLCVRGCSLPSKIN